MLQQPFYYVLEQEISTEIRTMRKKVNTFMLQLPIFEQEIWPGTNADIAKTKKGEYNAYCFG